MADQHEVDLDSIIDRLLEVRGSRPGKQVQLLESEIRFLCTKAREIFISQPILLELEAPIKVCRPIPVLIAHWQFAIASKGEIHKFFPSPFLRFWIKQGAKLVLDRFVAISTANTTIFCVCSSMVASP